MIKNHLRTNHILNSNQFFYVLLLILICSFQAHSQCATPVVGCSNTDLTNFGTDSNNNAATLEYDNFISGFHTTIVRTSTGTFETWGEKIGNNGVLDVLSPLAINSTNFPALTTSTPLKGALGSNYVNLVQGVLLTTDGLYAWSSEGIVLDPTITSGAVFQKLTINGNANGLPIGVTPGDVKMMFGTFHTLAITTCSGDVWVISQNANVRGNGAAGNALTWYRVTTNAVGNPFLTNVVSCRGSANGLMALKSDGTVYVWGDNVLIGNNTAVIATQTRAIQMALPVGITPKMIGSTVNTSLNHSYYVLATDGNLFAVGENSSRQLGDWTTTDRLSWVQPRYTSAAGPVMDNIKWISPQEHDTYYACINLTNSNKNLYAFGQNSSSLIGTPSDPSNPVIPNGLSAADLILAVETGGHTSMVVRKCDLNFGYVGHRIRGSMGNGSATASTETSYNFATAAVQICGAESLPIIEPATTGTGPTSNYCIGSSVVLNPSPAGGTLVVLSGPGFLTGNTLSFTALGTVVVQYTVATACGGSSVAIRNLVAEYCYEDLQIVKTVSNPTPYVGSNVTFTITASNAGPGSGTGVVVNDVLPAGYTFVSATPSVGVWTAPNWIIGNLANGATATLTIVAMVNAAGPYANTATISGIEVDPIPENNTSTATTVPIVQTDLFVVKTVSNPTPYLGSNVTFTITAGNAGLSNATGVVVNDVLPAGYVFVSATPSTGTWTDPIWTIGNLANGATATLTIVATVNATGPYANTATISGTEADLTPANNTSTATTAPMNIIDAVDDPAVTVTLGSGATTVPGSVITNDTLNGVPVTTTNTNVTPITTGPLSVDTNGVITVAANTPSGTYVVTYQICEADPATGLNMVPANCDTATATVIVFIPINAVDDAATTTSGSTGVLGIIDIFGNDTLNGNPIGLSQVTLTVIAPDPTGHIVLNPDGTVNVNPGTPEGTYVITYQICEIGASPANCDTATVTVIVTTTTGDIDIYTHMTPNGDGDNEEFFIDGIGKYPNNNVEIYNRWGILIYAVKGYNNKDVAFRGTSQGRTTVVVKENLPEGTYYYIVRYTKENGESKEKTGYLYINR